MTTEPAATTFLFTDIAGSTRRWEQWPAAMAAALARHDALLAEAIAARGGRVFKTVGDAFCAAFPAPGPALAAALSAQHALAAEDWAAFAPELPALGVRMAVHAGPAEARGGDFFGPTVNRVARLLAAGHPGQVLLSDVAAELSAEDLPAGASLRTLGRHRLKDLALPIEVFQLIAPGLATDFPPLASLDRLRHNLPLLPNPLLGRERELAELRDLVTTGERRLITLTGAGGTGKTRLAIQVAAEVLDAFGQGVFLVDLAPIVDPGLVPAAVASALHLVETPGEPVAWAIRTWLAHKQVLLVLDNFEQILAAAPFVAELLGGSPGLRVLATSRAPLRLAWEHEYPLAPMPVPDRPAQATPDDLTRYAALQLFIQRATAVRPDFQVTTANAPAIAQVCARLDGLPLAIELAAARVRALSPQAILDRLDQRLRLLAGGGRDLPERQQTMRAAVGWSYDLLAPAEQRLFRTLAVFSGGCTLEAAEAVCRADADVDVDVWDGLPKLVEQSLVRSSDADNAEPRYTQLETLRAFGLDCLAETGELAAARDRHLAWCAELATMAAAELEGPGQPAWLDRLDRELDNLRAALDWSLRSGQAALGLGIAADLSHFWYQRWHTAEARQLLEALLGAAGDQAAPLVRSRAWRSLGSMCMYQGATAEAGHHFAAAHEAAGADDTELARGLAQHTWQAWAAGDGALAADLWRQAVERLGPEGRPWDRAILEMVGCVVADTAGDLGRALEHSRASLAAFQAAGDPYYTAIAYNNLGWALTLQGRPAEAVDVLQHGRELAEAHGYIVALINCHESLGRAAREAGDADLARRSVRAALTLGRRHGIAWHIAVCLLHLGALALAGGRARQSAVLLGAAEATAEATGQSAAASDPTSRQALAGQASEILGAAAFADAFTEGRRLNVDEAIDLGIRSAGGDLPRGLPDA